MRVSLTSVVVLFLCASGPAAEPPRRPNVVFLYADDQRYDALSVVQEEEGDKGRFPWFKTPNMDRLASEGTRFRNAFVVNSLCSPSRACFLTGWYSHHNGVVNNHTPFPAANVTFADLLRKAGYVTGYFGKFHHGNMPTPRPGFDHCASFIGQGRYVDCPIDVDGKQVESKGWVDDVTTDYAIRFLTEHKSKPFLCVLGFKSPHGPFDPPARRKDAFAGESARRVPNLDSRAPYQANPKPKAADGSVPTKLGYFRCIAAVDDNVGRVLKALDDLGLADDTLVVYSSDNGFYLGEHGLGDKRTAYDESLRIPLIVRYPRAAGWKGKTLDEMALNIDLAPTVLDLAGVPVPKEVQGRSWRPVLDGKADGWRSSFFYEYFFETNFAAPTTTAVRTTTAKLIKYPGHDDWTELFDLAADPYETKNLYADPDRAELRAKLEAEYAVQAKAVGYHVPAHADDPAKTPATKNAANAVVLDYRFDKDDGATVTDAGGKGHHGTARNLPAAGSLEGKPCRTFDGKGHIDVPRSAALDPSGGAWAVEAVVKAADADGVVLARGGATNGYCLYLAGGKPAFAVNAANRGVVAEGKDVVTGKWVHLAGTIAADGTITLYVNGEVAGSAKQAGPIPRDPADGMQIGADLGSAVRADAARHKFTGSVARVQVYDGPRSAADVRAASAELRKEELELSEDEKALLDATNAERKRADLPELKPNKGLFSAARAHAANMAKQDKLEHTLDEKTADDRVTAAGYRFSRTGENVAKGPPTPKEALESWMNSEGHKENILNKEYADIGVAVAKNARGERYWVQVFATPLR